VYKWHAASRDFTGTGFKPALRRPLSDILHLDSW
jgi:hypothetical protein